MLFAFDGLGLVAVTIHLFRVPFGTVLQLPGGSTSLRLDDVSRQQKPDAEVKALQWLCDYCMLTVAEHSHSVVPTVPLVRDVGEEHAAVDAIQEGRRIAHFGLVLLEEWM